MRLAFVLLALVVRAAAADVTLAFDLRWNGQALAVPSGDLRNAAGQPLRVTRFSALISGVTLTRADGSTVALPNQFGWLDAGSGRLAASFQDVPVGDYTGIAFQIGLPVGINHAEPSRWPAGHVLNPLVNRLHWSWQGEYIFAAFEGRWREAAGADIERGFSYHIVGDDHLMPVRFAAAFSVPQATTIRFALELSKVLGAQKLAPDDGSDSTHSATQDPVVGRIENAVKRAFFWLTAEPTPPSVARAGIASSRTAATGAAVGHPVAFKVPAAFPTPSLPDDNPLTSEGIALGEALFTEKRLSGNGTQSCADCHSAKRGFSDRVAVSRGADGEKGTRNAMPLFNLAWSPSFAWDGGKPKIRDQAIAAMTNPIEMHGDRERVVAALAADREMTEKFRAAFGSPDVTIERIGLALEQALLMKVSADSKFDRAIRGDGALTEQEKEGFALFMTEFDPARGRRGADCFHCHGGPLFTDYDFKNNGLDAKSADPARRGITHRDEDAAKFKTPSLRNIAVTAPYMHDGRFATLEDVVAHYNGGVARSATLDPNLAKHPVGGLGLTKAEQQALVAFLRTLTDAQWEKID